MWKNSKYVSYFSRLVNIQSVVNSDAFKIISQILHRLSACTHYFLRSVEFPTPDNDWAPQKRNPRAVFQKVCVPVFEM